MYFLTLTTKRKEVKEMAIYHTNDSYSLHEVTSCLEKKLNKSQPTQQQRQKMTPCGYCARSYIKIKDDPKHSNHPSCRT